MAERPERGEGVARSSRDAGPASEAPSMESELLGDFVEALGGVAWLARQRTDPESPPSQRHLRESGLAPAHMQLDESGEVVARSTPSGPRDPHLDPPQVGEIINGRYEVLELTSAIPLRLIAYDQSTRQRVVLRIADADLPEVSVEALRREMYLAQAVGHPAICRVHDLAPCAWGHVLVQDDPGPPLAHVMAERVNDGTLSADEFRAVATGLADAITSVHARGLVHGALAMDRVHLSVGEDDAVTEETVRLMMAQPTSVREQVLVGHPGIPLAGTARYQGPERLEGGGPSRADDVYALGRLLLELLAIRDDEYEPRARPLWHQVSHDVPLSLTTDELRNLYYALSDEPPLRPQPRQLALTRSPARPFRGSFDPGPPPIRTRDNEFVAGRQSLLVTWSGTAPENLGRLLPLTAPELTLGRRDQTITIYERTLSRCHATFAFQGGSWRVTDMDTLNGTFARDGCDRRDEVLLRHGEEVQLGELRLMLVGFSSQSQRHLRARRMLQRYHGITRLPRARFFRRLAQEEAAFADWLEQPMWLAKYTLTGKAGELVKSLAARAAAQSIISATEAIRNGTVVAGHVYEGMERTPTTIAVCMIGRSPVRADEIVAEITPRARRVLPNGVDITATLLERNANQPIDELLFSDV